MNIKQDAIDILSINDKIKDNDLFRHSNLSDSDFDSLKLNIIQLKKGEILFRKGDSANSIYMIIEGEINLIKKQSYGKTKSCLSNNNFLGHEEYFLQTNRNSIAIALKNSCIAEVIRENFEIFLSRHNSILINIKNSLLNLDSETINKFEKIINEQTKSGKKLYSEIPNELKTNNNEKYMLSNVQNKLFIPEANMQIYNQIDLNKVETSMNKTIKNIYDSMSLLDLEKNEVCAALSEYEKSNKELLERVEMLRERENKYLKLDKEKNEVLGHQGYKIIELERETAKFKEIQFEYSKKIELLDRQELKNKSKIENLEAELKEKETIISNLYNELKESKKYSSGLTETQLSLTNKTNDQEQIINVQKAELENLGKKVETLTFELSAKDSDLTRLEKDLLNKRLIVSAHDDNLSKAEAKIQELLNTLAHKDESAKNLSATIDELQNKLDYQEESEKNKNKEILSQLNKINEYEELLNGYKEKLSRTEENTNNLIQEIRELSVKMKQKEIEIHEQGKINKELNNELNALHTSVKDASDRRDEFEEKFLALKYHISKVNVQLNSLSEEVKEKSRLIELKEIENSDIQKILVELKTTLENKDNKIHDLNNQIDQKKNEISGSNKLKEVLKSQNNEFVSLNNAYAQLKKENDHLVDQLKNLKLKIEENENEDNKLSKVSAEHNKLKTEEEQSKNSLIEKDGIIKGQKEQIENLKLNKFEMIKTFSSTKNNYEEEIKKKDKLIDGLTTKLKFIQKSLEEKTFLENQHIDLIENQAQKIAEFELLANKSKVKDNNQIIIKKENGLKEDFTGTNSEEQNQSKEKEGLSSKFNLIAPMSISDSMTENSFEHFEHMDIRIINVNLTRATMDVATTFNESLQEVIRSEKNKIIVNLLKCEFIDSSILGVLVSNLKKVTTIGGDLRLVGFHPTVHSMLELTRVNRLFESFPTVEAAIRSFEQ